MDTILKNVSYKFKDQEPTIGQSNLGLDDVSFTLKQGSFNIIVGRSGCGKSTLLRMVAGIINPDSGDIHVPKSVSMVFQGGALLPWRTVEENVGLAFEGKKKIPKSEYKIIDEELNRLKILAHKENYPRALSGGERQRVGIARALVVKPELLLLDEPFSALDAENTRSLHAETLSIWKKSGMTILMVSHSIEEALLLADKIIVMKAGKIKEEIPVGLERPRDEDSPNFVGLVHQIKKMI